MELQELETFVNIVQQGNFSRAAIHLGYTQAAVTIQIKKLERELGVKLFERLGRKTTLTGSGKIFYDHAVEILNGITRAKEAVEMEGDLQGEISIGTIDSLCSSVMHSLVRSFHRTHPKVKIRIVTDTIDELIQKMSNNVVDIIYIVDEKRTLMDCVKVMEKEEKCVFATSSLYDYDEGKSIFMKNIMDSQFVLTEKDASYRRLLDAHLHEQDMEIIPYLESTNTDLILHLLRGNEGLSFLPEYVLEDDIKKGNLKVIPVEDVDISIWHQIYYHKNKWITKEMDAFLKSVISSIS